MEKVEARSMASGGNDRLKVLNDEIQKLMDMEECMWNQQLKLIGFIMVIKILRGCSDLLFP